MMPNLIFLYIFSVTIVRCQNTNVNWGVNYIRAPFLANIACLVNRNDYFTEVMQKTMKAIETNINWCNMKVDDINQSVNKSYYNWHVLGSISYRNGFTISLKGIQLTNMRTIFSTKNVNGTDHGNLFLDGTIRLIGLKIGFDVETNFADSDKNHFSVTHEYESIGIVCSLNRDLYTNVTTTNTGYPSVPGVRSVTTMYLPTSNITDVVNREFTPNVNAGSFEKWGKNIIAPLMQKYASVVDFPGTRFGGC